jgi:hypothetical protein
MAAAGLHSIVKWRILYEIVIFFFEMFSIFCSRLDKAGTEKPGFFIHAPICGFFYNQLSVEVDS